MFCPKCGDENQEYASFCKDCGEKLDFSSGFIQKTAEESVIEKNNEYHYDNGVTPVESIQEHSLPVNSHHDNDILEVLAMDNHVLFFTRNSMIIAKAISDAAQATSYIPFVRLATHLAKSHYKNKLMDMDVNQILTDDRNNRQFFYDHINVIIKSWSIWGGHKIRIYAPHKKYRFNYTQKLSDEQLKSLKSILGDKLELKRFKNH